LWLPGKIREKKLAEKVLEVLLIYGEWHIMNEFLLSKKFFMLVGLVCILAITPLLVAPARAATPGWIMAYFTENPNNYDLHIAYSTDALHWTALNSGNPVAHPTLGYQGLRDPFILRKQDGTFVVMATNMNGTNFTQTSPAIHIWDSADLTAFSNYRLVRMTATNMHAWAPEAFWDAGRGQYAILWSGNTDRNRIYVNYTTDFINMGTEQVYFDPGFSVLDANVITGSTNYLYYKRESDNSLYGSKSTSLNPGSFNNATYTGALRQGNAIEAPELLPNGSTWYLYGDSYSPVNGVIYAWQTTNIAGNSWSVLNRSSYAPPPAAKHPGIVAVPDLTNILARWGGGPTPTRTPTRTLTRTPTPNGPTLTPTRTPTPGGVTNLALGRTATTDSAQSANPVANGNDGSTSTRWCAANGSTGHWWKVDLGSARNLTGSEVMWEFARNYRYRVEISTDNTNWTTVVDKTNNTSTAQTQNDPFTANARYVRITVTGLPTTPTTWASFFEFRVFGN
jgi:hypothetical protein